MQTFRIDGDNNRLYFKNDTKRAAEEELREVMDILKAAGCTIGKRRMLPDCDLYNCQYNTMEFDMICEMDGDGTFLYSKDENTLRCLEMIFRQCAEILSSATGAKLWDMDDHEQ